MSASVTKCKSAVKQLSITNSVTAFRHTCRTEWEAKQKLPCKCCISSRELLVQRFNIFGSCKTFYWWILYPRLPTQLTPYRWWWWLWFSRHVWNVHYSQPNNKITTFCHFFFQCKIFSSIKMTIQGWRKTNERATKCKNSFFKCFCTKKKKNQLTQHL